MAQFADIKGFVFDLDGVITDTAQYHATAWHKTADTVHTEWTPELAEALKGIGRMESLEMILVAGGHADEYSQAEKDALGEAKNQYYQELIANLSPADILPGMAKFLHELKSNGYLLSLASASHNAPGILEKLGLIELFDQLVDPATLSAGKPDPEIYVKGAEILELQPNQVIGVEDAPAGVQSINAAGEVSIGIGTAVELPTADIRFDDTSSVNLENIMKSEYFAR
jgi:beta-phosphoglucomutase